MPSRLLHSIARFGFENYGFFFGIFKINRMVRSSALFMTNRVSREVSPYHLFGCWMFGFVSRNPNVPDLAARFHHLWSLLGADIWHGVRFNLRNPLTSATWLFRSMEKICELGRFCRFDAISASRLSYWGDRSLTAGTVMGSTSCR